MALAAGGYPSFIERLRVCCKLNGDGDVVRCRQGITQMAGPVWEWLVREGGGWRQGYWCYIVMACGGLDESVMGEWKGRSYACGLTDGDHWMFEGLNFMDLCDVLLQDDGSAWYEGR